MAGRLTPARLRAARALLGTYPFGNYDTVLTTLTEQFGFKVTAEALGTAFQRAGLSSPDLYMSGAPAGHCESCTCKRSKR